MNQQWHSSQAILQRLLTWQRQHHSDSPQQRLDYLTQSLLGTRYELHPLGEGQSALFCQKPLFRFDAFDCLTFVNTALALLHANNENEFVRHLARLTYQHANISYENRLHFISSEWNPSNTRNGYICDVTHTIKDPAGASIYQHCIGSIDKANWLLHHKPQHLHYRNPLSQKQLQQKLSQLHQLATTQQNTTVSMPYLPLTRLFNEHGAAKLEIFQQLPSFGIVEIIRPNWDLRETIGTRLHVSHLGFFLKKEHQYYLRHASSQQSIQAVTEQSLIDYLQAYLHHPTVKGISVFSIPDQISH